MKKLHAFDYLVFTIGAIGTLNVFGVPTGMPQLVLIILGALSAIACCFAILLLAFDRFVRRFDREQRRIYVYYILANIIPTIYILSHLKETPSGLFTC